MSEQTFDIGLVGAGAISAGAYTGGVIDFMVQALDEWYALKAAGDGAPPHDVRISVFSGASAGGITAALAAGYLGSEQPPITNEAEGLACKGENKLFDSWVDRIDIAALLEDRDLQGKDSPVVSLLDSTVLSEIADSGLNVAPRQKRRPYIAEDFNLLLTVTNLRGVPYEIKLAGPTAASHTMSLHADYVHFRISDGGGHCPPDRFPLTWADLGTAHPVVDMLKTTALASGAFPVGLAPRTLSHVLPGNGGPDWYSSRIWPVPTPDSHDPHECVSPESIPANWGDVAANYRYHYQCADGGVMDNEPLELARRFLAGATGRNPREGEKASRAVLLIDPFPSDTTFNPDYQPAPDLVKAAVGLFGALKNQARFKPEELMLAAHEQVYSRFMIAPTRGRETHPIACGSLGGFGGFLKREFRAHDYFLGRRNAQKFFRDHFVLPENNPLFAAWTPPMKEAFCVRDPDSDQPILADGQRFLPIIPLVGEAKTPCYRAEWPRYSDRDLEQLVERVENRVGKVIDRLVGQYFKTNNLIVRLVARLVLGRKKADVVAFIRRKVAGDLKKMQLMA